MSYHNNTTTSTQNTTTHNTTTEHHHSTPLSLHITIATTITCSNAVVVAIYLSMRRRKRTISNYLVFAQAMADIFQAMVAWYECVIDVLDRRNTLNIPMQVHYSFQINGGGEGWLK